VLERDGKARLTLLHLRWGRQHQRIAKLDDLPDFVRVDDFERHQSAGRILDVDVARLGDQMIQSLERHLDDVIVGIVGNAEQRQPLRFDLIAKAQRSDFDFGLFAFERARDAIATAVCRACGWSWQISYLAQGEELCWSMLRLS